MAVQFRSVISPLIEIVFTLVEALLGLRVILKFFGANPATPFVNWVYETSEPLLTPFSGMFPAPVIEGRFVLEFSTLFALIIYGLIAYLLIALIEYLASLSERS
jgi:uncharacterized protein YggT (Ycf19 family)